MPKCYGIILSIDSSLHPTTNTWNLFGLIDNILTKDLPITIPLEIHVFWYFAPEDIRQDFEARIVIDIEKMQVKHSEPILFSSSTPYTHLRLRGITIDHTGECHAYIEWRRIDSSDWTREDVFWPFIVSLQPK
jgi:hypothetical protein